jgi:oligopeptide transport system substrate-binding protein
MRRFLIPLAVAVAVTLVTALLAFRTQGPKADLVWTAGTEVATLDPNKMNALQDGRVAAALFEGLTVIDAETLKVRPGVAQSWQVSPDGLVYTFDLRQSARWSDGKPVTAEDFVYSWRRVLEPRTAAEYAYILYPIRGARAYYDTASKAGNDPAWAGGGADAAWAGVGIRAEGPYRLTVTLERPCAYFLDLTGFTTYLPVRRDVIEKYGDRWTLPGNIISDGAFRLAEWRFQSRMTWEKNPYYWDAASVALGRVEVLVFKDVAALEAYETGAVALTTVVPSLAVPPLLAARESGRRNDVRYDTVFATYFYRINCVRPPFSDARLRRALALAIDRQAIIERAARGGQKPAFTLMPPGYEAYKPPAGLTEDVQEARRLLAEAGFPGGAGLGEPAILVNKDMGHIPIAEMLQQQWRQRLGINVRIEQVEWKVFLDRISRVDYEIARGGWYGDYVDPNTFLDLFVTGRGNNSTGWSNEEYDRLIEAAANQTDAAARMEDFRRAEEILLREAPIIPIYFYTQVMLVRPGLEGVYSNPLNRIDFGVIRWATNAAR